MASKAALKRLDAIRSVVDTFIDAEGIVSSRLTVDNAVTIIGSLSNMGYTDRWENSLLGWMKLIQDNPDDLAWAITQGSIFAGYAAL